MLARRIIPCLDVAGGQVVKGIRFRDHAVVGAITELASRYRDEGADELVFYDIEASAQGRRVDTAWIKRVAACLDIPFCVAGGIRSVSDAAEVLAAGADKISINSPALESPQLIDELAEAFGRQCVVVGVDSMASADGSELTVWQYTGSDKDSRATARPTIAWIREVQERGAGEIVLNCMNADGTGAGYDLKQLQAARAACSVPLVASGGAGCAEDFLQVFRECDVDGALAAGIFHRRELSIPALKSWLNTQNIEVRL